MTFKIGDRVKINQSAPLHLQNRVGIIIKVLESEGLSYPYYVKLDGSTSDTPFEETELILLSSPGQVVWL